MLVSDLEGPTVQYLIQPQQAEPSSLNNLLRKLLMIASLAICSNIQHLQGAFARALHL